MSKAEDITNLFRRFGGDAGSYHEIVERDQATAAKRTWPMLGDILPQAHQEAPAARQGAPVSQARQRQPDEPVRAAAKPPLRLSPLGAVEHVQQPVNDDPAPAQMVVAAVEPVLEGASAAAPVPTPVEIHVPQPAPFAFAPLPVRAPVEATATVSQPPSHAAPQQVRMPVAAPTVPLDKPHAVPTRHGPVMAQMPVHVPSPSHVFAPPAEPKEAAQATERNELQQMFARMSRLPNRAAEADQAASPLKRLIKW